jgi:hypothetical protein
MAYVTPTINPSGITYAQLQQVGFPGHVELLIAANGFSQTQINHLHSLVKQTDYGGFRKFEGLISNWLQQFPIATADLTQRILDHTTAFKAILAVMEEEAVLFAANPGTLANSNDGAGMPVPYRIL